MSETAMQFANAEIRAALDELPPLPTEVSDWVVETGTDSADEPAVWVWAVLPEATSTSIPVSRFAIRSSTSSGSAARYPFGSMSASKPLPKWAMPNEPACRPSQAGPPPRDLTYDCEGKLVVRLLGNQSGTEWLDKGSCATVD